MSSFLIRTAQAADAGVIYRLIVELAAFEREPEAVVITEADLLRDGWGPQPRFASLVCEDGGAVCGFALYHPVYSTWTGHSMYLEDLYVQPSHRGRGLGTALLARVAAEAKAQGCARLDWSVLTWNEPAIRMYEKIGAFRMEEWRRMRLAGEPLRALPGGSTGRLEPISQNRDVGHPFVQPLEPRSQSRDAGHPQELFVQEQVR